MKKGIVLFLTLTVALAFCACSGKKESNSTSTTQALTSILSSEPTAAEVADILGKDYDEYDDDGKNSLYIRYNSFSYYGLNGDLRLYFERQSENDKAGDFVLDALEWVHYGNREEILSSGEKITSDFSQIFGKYREETDGGSLELVWKNDRLVDVFLQYFDKNDDNERRFSLFPDSDGFIFVGYGNC